MQEESFPAAEKILSDIEKVIGKDVDIQSFEIIPIPNSENRSPVHHTEHSLGLASWCVQPLYTYTFTHLMDYRQKKKHRDKPPTTISRWLMGALLLNPEVTTFWNMRRELVKNSSLEFTYELRFSKIVLFNKPKCFEAFSYRRWLLQYVLVEEPNPVIDVESMLRNEISIAGMPADRYGSNYNAWLHREHMITMYEELCPPSLPSLLNSEWDYSKEWCSCHVSDHSGLAYRQFLMKKIILLDKQNKFAAVLPELNRRWDIVLNYVGEHDLQEISSPEEFLIALHGEPEQKSTDSCQARTLVGLSYWVEDAVLNQELISLFPGHEALWYHRRFLAFTLKALTRSYRKFGMYRWEFFEPRKIMNSVVVGNSLLEEAFDAKNCEIVDVAKKTDCELHIVDKFVKFVASLGLDG